MFGKRRLPAHMVLIPMDRDEKPKKNQRTEMRYIDIEFDAEVPESTFSLSELERKRMLDQICTELLSRASAYGFTLKEVIEALGERMEERRA